MKKLNLLLLLILLAIIPSACEDMDDNAVPGNLQTKDFVWKGMNLYYLWQQDVADLADNRFGNQSQLNSFLNTYSDPVTLFNQLRTNPALDRFSVIHSDYSVLEGILSGTTLNNGMDFGLKYKSGSSTSIYGWVRYVLPNSDAAAKNVTRGQIFYAVDGVALTSTNYKTLLSANTYTINLADFDNGNITPNGQFITLTKTNLSENPILVNTVISQGTRRVGYLMYNGFYSGYDTQLNNTFGSFLSQNVTDLVLDLRYNSGGSIATATKLASMITGQFPGQLFARQQWNAKAQAYYMNNNPGALDRNFLSGFNSLNLSRVYVLTSKSSASASELVINCLKPYVDVIQIGDVTSGKNVGSITLYDSPTFTKTNVNPNHKYAMQPIVLKVVNKNGFGDYTSGILPSYTLVENLANPGVLGSPDEPLLSAALIQIGAAGKPMPVNPAVTVRDFEDSKSIVPLRNEMYPE